MLRRVANVYMNGRSSDERLVEREGVSDCVSLLDGGRCGGNRAVPCECVGQR